MMDRKSKIEYLPLDDDDVVYSEVERCRWSPAGLRDMACLQTKSNMGWVLLLCNAVLFSLSTILFILSTSRHLVSYDIYRGQPSLYAAAPPGLDYQTKRFSIDTLVKDSEYVGYGPKVDKAWNHIASDVGDQMISPQELDRLGLDPTSLKIEDRETGEFGYRAGMQVFHQLDCLNLLRKDSFRDYYSSQSREFHGPRRVLRRRLDYCIESLRMSLMCQSDVGVFTYRHVEGISGQWPDLNGMRTCRNFDSIRNWAADNSIEAP
jgi:hypothetical protein